MLSYSPPVITTIFLLLGILLFWQARISEEDSVKLVGTVSDEEIVSGLWSLMAYKAPSPDGLHVGFL